MHFSIVIAARSEPVWLVQCYDLMISPKFARNENRCIWIASHRDRLFRDL